MYSIENVMAYSMVSSFYAPLYSHLRYDVFRNGEFIGQETDFLAALRMISADLAFRLWRGPLGFVCRDEDMLEAVVWRFVRNIKEDRGEAKTISNRRA